MNIQAFDTLKAAKELQAAGFEERQAEAVITTVGAAVTENLVTKTDLAQALWPLATKDDLAKTDTRLAEAIAQMATKDDLAKVEADLAKLEAQMATKAQLDKLEARMATKDDLVVLQQRMIIVLGSITTVGIGIILAALRMLL